MKSTLIWRARHGAQLQRADFRFDHSVWSKKPNHATNKPNHAFINLTNHRFFGILIIAKYKNGTVATQHCTMDFPIIRGTFSGGFVGILGWFSYDFPFFSASFFHFLMMIKSGQLSTTWQTPCWIRMLRIGIISDSMLAKPSECRLHH